MYEFDGPSPETYQNYRWRSRVIHELCGDVSEQHVVLIHFPANPQTGTQTLTRFSVKLSLIHTIRTL